MRGPKSRWLLVACAVLAGIASIPASPRAQAPTPTPDPTAAFFDDSVVHDVYFTINTKDWETLKVNYLDNTYYPVDFKWGTNTQQACATPASARAAPAAAAARNRACGSTSIATRPDRRSWAEVADLSQQHPGSDEHA